MTTTAFDDQFVTGKATAQLRKPYDTVAILRRNIADAEKEMQRQAERAESYADTLRSLASYVGAGGYNADTVDAGVFEDKIRWGIGEIMARMERAEAELVKMAQQKPVAWMREDGNLYLAWQKDLCLPEVRFSPLYAVPAPAVPLQWREVMTELAADLQAACDAEHPHRDQYPSVMRKYNNDMEIVEKARALLQSAPQAPAVPKEWRRAVSEFLSSHDAAWAELFKSLPADTRSVTVSNHQADAVRKANALRALLQSEVRHD